MRQRLRAAVVAVAAIAASLLVTTSAAALPPGCHFDEKTNTLVCGTSDPGNGGGADRPDPPAGQPEDPPAGGSGGGQNHDGPPPSHGGGTGDEPNEGQLGFQTPAGLCLNQPFPAAPQPAASDPGWDGHTAADNGQVMQCRSDPNGRPFTFWQAGGVAAPPPPPPPPVDRAALARAARAAIQLPDTTFGFGPDRKRLAVNTWTWVWVDAAGSVDLSASKSERGVAVTVTGHPTSVTWNPGEPVNCTVGNGDSPCSPGAVPAVTCDGLGVAPTGGITATTQPPCGYQYKWRSMPGRTGGAKAWPITGTVTWTFTFTSAGTGDATGPAGDTWTEQVPIAATSVYMGEWRTRAVCNPGSVDCPPGG